MTLTIEALVKAAVAQAASDAPLKNARLEDLEAGYGIRKFHDRTFEENRKARERKRTNDLRSAARRRDREERLAVTRKEREERVRNPHRMTAIYHKVIAPIRHLIADTARAKGNHISRHMGGIEIEDVVSDAIERVAIALCGYDIEVVEMAKVAKLWHPRKSLPPDEVGLSKIMAQAVNIQCMKAVSQWWRDNPTLDSIEKLASMEHNSYGVDGVIAACHADGGMGIVGWRPSGPGKVDPALVSHILNGILEGRHLQDVADVIMGMEEDEEGNLTHRLNTDGSFPWYRYSRQLWLACGLDERVYKMIPKKKRAQAVQVAVRNRFAIVQTVLERACNLLANHGTNLNKMQMLGFVEVEHAPVSQAPTMSTEDLLAAIVELMEV